MPPGEWPGVCTTPEGAVAEIDDIASARRRRGRRGVDPVGRRVPAFRPAIEHLLGRVAVGERPVIARIGEDMGFGAMHAAVGEIVMAADVIEMRVARDAERDRSLTIATCVAG